MIGLDEHSQKREKQLNDLYSKPDHFNKMNTIIWIAIVWALMFLVFGQIVFAVESATDVVSVTETVRLQQENADLKKQVQMLSTEVQALSVKAAARKCEIAENYLLFATIHRLLVEAIRSQDWGKVHQSAGLIFAAIYQWNQGKE